MAARLLLSELTREEVRQIAATTLVVIPTSAAEQHGPHLPIRTDTELCGTVCRRAAEIASAEVPVVIAPTLHFGSSHHHFPFPGVVSLSSETFYRVVVELVDSLARSGFRRVMIVNGHGGNDDLIRQAARDAVLRHDIVIAAASYWTIARQSLIDEARVLDVGPLPGHAGGFETSCMMAARPDLVGPDARPPRREAVGGDRPTLAGGVRINQRPGAQRADGCSDDARDASPAAGERFLAIIAREVARAFVQLGRM